MSPTVYLVTGANRGIGYQFVESLSSRPDTVVFAGVRSLPKDQDKLAQLSSKYPDTVIPVKITSADEAENAAAADLVREKMGKVDVIIANAGVTSGIKPLLEFTAQDFQNDFHVNALGLFVLFKAFHPLLSASANPKLAVISSVSGQITDMANFQFAAYGTSKAAVNYLTKKIDQEFPNVITFPIHPGLVDTDMGRSSAAQFGSTAKDLGAISEITSVQAILALVDAATKETHGGKFWDYKGEQMTY